MNPEIHLIVEDMINRAPTDGIRRDPDPQSYHLSRLAKLLALLSDEAEKNAIKTEKATKWIVRLTWVIAVLTFFLVLTAFLDFPKFHVPFPQIATQKIETHAEKKDNENVQALSERSHYVPNSVNK